MNFALNNKLKTICNVLFIICVIVVVALGIYWRVRCYLMNVPLWWDEISLALSYFDRNLLGMFQTLEEGQKAPPLFCAIVWIIKYFWKGEELTYCFRLLPLLCGIGSLFAFYFLSKDLLKSKLAILLSMWLFVQNGPLIYYCWEFKPYSSDVFVCILMLLMYKKISFKDITLSKSVGYSILFACLMLFSFPCLFIVPAVILLKIIEEKSINKKMFIIPIGFIVSLIYTYLLYKKQYQVELLESEWQKGFLSFSFSSNCNLLTEFINFLYNYNGTPGTQYLIFIIMFIMFIVLGGGLLIASKKQETYLIAIILCFTVIASFLHIYPLVNRMILYLIPFIILALAKLVDFEDLKNRVQMVKSFVLCVFVLYFLQCYNLPFFNVNGDALSYRVPISSCIDSKELILEMCQSMSDGDRLYAGWDLYVHSKYYSFLCKGYVPFKYFEIFNSQDKDEILKNLGVIYEEMSESEKLYILLRKMYVNDDELNISIFNEVEKLLNDKKILFEKAENESFLLYKIKK